jgi:hypothetical protein
VDPVLITALVGLAAAVIASGTTYKLAGPSANKLEAEETEIITRTALGLIQPLRDELQSITRRVADLEKENRALILWSRMLSAQVIEGGATPVPFEAATN